MSERLHGTLVYQKIAALAASQALQSRNGIKDDHQRELEQTLKEQIGDPKKWGSLNNLDRWAHEEDGALSKHSISKFKGIDWRFLTE